MMCTRPIVVTYSPRLNRNSKTDVVVKAPYKHSILCQCGKCDECLKQYQNDWMVRCYYELKRSKFAVFFTLTYREDAVPEVFDEETGERFTSVHKETVQLFLKRIREARRRRGDNTGFRYFITSEYGPTTLRAHYHGILFYERAFDFHEFAADWKRRYGFVQFREINVVNQKTALNSIRYVAKYCAKGVFENPYIRKGFVEPTFHLISKNLGDNYLTKEKYDYHLASDFVGPRVCDGKYTNAYLEEISKRLNVVISPCTYHLPRYYREVVFDKRKDLQVAYQDFICERLMQSHYPSLVSISTDKPYRSASEAHYFENLQVIRDKGQRASDSRKSVTKFLIKSQI